MVVDTHKDRLALAEQIGAIAIDDTEGDGVQRVLDMTQGRGADRGCERVGFQCFNCEGREVSNLTMSNLVKAVKATGSIGVVGVFMPKDPGGADALAKQGQIAFDFGEFFTKGQRIGTGQTKAYNRQLCRMIEAGTASHRSSCRTNCRCSRRRDAYKHSTSATMAGPRSC